MSSLDPSKISVISATRVDRRKLSSVGDTAATLPKEVEVTAAAERRCNWCCAAYGSLLDSVTVFLLTGALTGIAIFSEKRVNYSLNGAFRQVAWLSFPGTLVGLTLHYFLSEAMWSGKRNSWGQAWTKAIVFNAAVWTTGVGVATVCWRKLLPLSSAGRRLYHRYAIPTEPLETRVLRTGKEFFSGMGSTYWLSGVASGHLGLLSVVAFCIVNDRPYMMMAPDGSYARQCMPLWRRQQLAALANVPLSDSSNATGAGAAQPNTIDGIRTGKGIEIRRAP